MVKTLIRYSLEGVGFTCLFGSLVMVSIGFALGAADVYGPFLFFGGIIGSVALGVGAMELSDHV